MLPPFFDSTMRSTRFPRAASRFSTTFQVAGVPFPFVSATVHPSGVAPDGLRSKSQPKSTAIAGAVPSAAGGETPDAGTTPPGALPGPMRTLGSLSGMT